MERLSFSYDTDVLLATYYGIFHPNLLHAVHVWGSDSTRMPIIYRIPKEAFRINYNYNKNPASHIVKN